jgi:hypothetical protein
MTVLGAKAPGAAALEFPIGRRHPLGATALRFPPGRRHPLGLPTHIRCPPYDSVQSTNSTTIPRH